METAKIIPFGPVAPPVLPCELCQWRLRSTMLLLEEITQREEHAEKRDLLLFAISMLATISPDIHK